VRNMITPDDLRGIAGRERIGLGIIERDHAITVALMILSKTHFSDALIFKGGTAIKKMFYPEARFSEDLDFNSQRDVARQLAREVRRPLLAYDEGARFTGVTVEDIRGEHARRLRLQYRDMNGYLTSIKLDLTFLEKTAMKTKRIKVKNMYDMKNIMIATMDIREIMAEKVRALIHTGRPRHLYDIWFLLGKHVKPTRTLINRKLSIYNQTFDADSLLRVTKETERDWETDLRALLPEVPRFSVVQSRVTKAFSKL